MKDEPVLPLCAHLGSVAFDGVVPLNLKAEAFSGCLSSAASPSAGVSPAGYQFWLYWRSWRPLGSKDPG